MNTVELADEECGLCGGKGWHDIDGAPKCTECRGRGRIFKPIPDANVEAVRTKMYERARTGLNKYGVTTEREDLSVEDWLVHAQEEAMDLTVYLQRAIVNQRKATKLTELVKDLFDILEVVEESSEGVPFSPTVIRSCRAATSARLGILLPKMKALAKELNNE